MSNNSTTISKNLPNNYYINLVTEMGANGFFLKDEVKTALPKLIGFFKSGFYELLRNNLYIMN
jgi:hypothetical protein